MTDRFFQPPELLADRRLRHVEPLGGVREAAGFGDRDEGAKKTRVKHEASQIWIKTPHMSHLLNEADAVPTQIIFILSLVIIQTFNFQMETARPIYEVVVTSRGNRMTKRLCLAACVAALLSSGASARMLQEKNMPMDVALELAQGAVTACAKDNYDVSAAVVDRAGILRALLRADNAGVHTPEAARRKAYTAASARTPTSAMAKTIQDNSAAAQLVAINDFLVLGGGVPVKLGNETIGAIGVGGAPGGHLDEACALAAIKQVEGKLE